MRSEHASAELLGALSKLHGQVQQASLVLQTPTVERVRSHQREVLEQLSDYILPRLVQLDAPLLVVVGGSTGAGKSTLVNSIVGEHVTESGVLRPTTRSPVLVHNPEDAHWFQPDRILPELPRTLSSGNQSYALRLATSSRIPKGLAILDAPDVDSIDKGNRDLAAQLLAAADLWLFVTSAARYADQVPWDYLRAAAERSASVAVVLDRTQLDSVTEVRGHLARMMTSRGLSDSPLFAVAESPLDHDGLLPADTVADITGWLHDLATDPGARAGVVAQTLDGAVRQIVFHAHDIADAMDEQVDAAAALYRDLDDCYQRASADIVAALDDGSLLRGEVLARWQDFVGTGELLRSVEDRASRIRDRIFDGITGKRTRSAEIGEAIGQGIGMLILEAVESAAETVSRGWRSQPAGQPLLDAAGGLDGASRGFRSRADRVVWEWQQGVFELVRTEGADKRMTAKFLALGVNGIGVALMIVMSTRRASDAAGVAGGTATIGRKLLEAIFGDQVVVELVERAHADLARRVAVLVDAERQRFGGLLDSPETITASQRTLRESAQQAEYARHTDFLADADGPESDRAAEVSS